MNQYRFPSEFLQALFYCYLVSIFLLVEKSEIILISDPLLNSEDDDV